MPDAGMSPVFMPVTEISRAITSGELRCAQLVESFLERIARYDGELHAFIHLYAEQALAAADAADRARRAGQAVGPLHGVPIALKDLIDLEGRITCGGSKVWAARVSAVTATLARRLMAAGVIVIGKTHTVEFAMGGWGTNRHLGTPRNPWDRQQHRAPGGSSSGSGVAVAAGLAPWAIGTDTGGSVRLPAAWCGLSGLKTTIGRISVFGVLPLSPTLDTPGPMCRTVEDAAALYDLLHGPDPLDPLTLRRQRDDPVPELRRGVAGLRLARMPDEEREGVEEAVLAAYDSSLDILRDLGARIVDVSLPRRFRELASCTGRIIGAEGYSFVGDLVDDMALPVDDDVRPRIQIGRDMSARDYLLTLREREEIKREFDAALAGVDALLTPTTAIVAPPVASIDQSTTPAIFTRIANLLDYCALSIPNGRSPEGLPTALQIVCRGYEEALALRIGVAYQGETEWHRATPAGYQD